MQHMNISSKAREEETSSYDDYDDVIYLSDKHGLASMESQGGDQSSDSMHGSAPIVITYDDRGILSPIRRKLLLFSTRSPQLFGFSLAFVVFVIPLTIILIVVSLKFVKSPVQTSSTDSTPPPSSSDFSPYLISSYHGAAAGDNAHCSQVAVSILEKGGNAVEGAVAGVICQGVLSPGSSGLGGGAFILTYNSSSDESSFTDSRETAPSASSENMFVGKPGKSQNGGLAIATLGELKGLHLVFQKHSSGNVEWSELVMPASILAARWQISPQFADILHSAEALEALSPQNPSFKDLKKLYCHSDGSVKEAGEWVENPALSYTLKEVATQGPDYLYVQMADILASEIQAAGGVITGSDIRGYQPAEHAAVSAPIMGHRLISASGSSSGGPVVAGIIRLMALSKEPLSSLGDSYYHRLVEAFKHCFAMRMSLGDPAFVNITSVIHAFLGRNAISDDDDKSATESHLSDDYLYSLYKTYYNDDHILNSADEYGGISFNHMKGNSMNFNNYDTRVNVKEDHGTSHFAVVDKDGNAVSITSTINTYLGSKVVSPSTGILFNNQMDDFSTPNATNTYGLAPFSSNYPQPNKRPLSSMSPSMVLTRCNSLKGHIGPSCDRGNSHQVRLIGGASGGPRIITATAQVILNFIARGMDILDAVTSPRVHCQLYPETVRLEHRVLEGGAAVIAISEEAKMALQARGHDVDVGDPLEGMGVSQFISIDVNPVFKSIDGSNVVPRYKIDAVSDPRKNGRPAGY